MKLQLPAIPEAERTPLVEALLAIIDALQQRTQQLEDTVQQLRDEIAILKGQKPRPDIKPSQLETPPPQPPSAEATKRPGSAKRPKNALLVITEDWLVVVPDAPVGSTHLRYEKYIVQDLVIEVKTTCYHRERIQLPDGSSRLAPLPEDVLEGQHFGAELIAYILYQYRQCNVTQPLLLEQLREMGIDISAGQISHILTEGHEEFHREKEAVLAVGLQVSSYIGVDDTGARHQGKNGYCTAIGNDLFAYFASTDSKSRLNFLQVLQGVQPGYTINETALAYFKKQELAQAVGEIERRALSVRERGGLAGAACGVGNHGETACAHRHRRSVVGTDHRTRSVAEPGDSQRWRPAIRPADPCVLLDSRGTALGTPGALQRRTPRGG